MKMVKLRVGVIVQFCIILGVDCKWFRVVFVSLDLGEYVILEKLGNMDEFVWIFVFGDYVLEEFFGDMIKGFREINENYEEWLVLFMVFFLQLVKGENYVGGVL